MDIYMTQHLVDVEEKPLDAIFDSFLCGKEKEDVFNGISNVLRQSFLPQVADRIIYDFKNGNWINENKLSLF